MEANFAYVIKYEGDNILALTDTWRPVFFRAPEQPLAFGARVMYSILNDFGNIRQAEFVQETKPRPIEVRYGKIIQRYNRHVKVLSPEGLHDVHVADLTGNTVEENVEVRFRLLTRNSRQGILLYTPPAARSYHGGPFPTISKDSSARAIVLYESEKQRKNNIVIITDHPDNFQDLERLVREISGKPRDLIPKKDSTGVSQASKQGIHGIVRYSPGSIQELVGDRLFRDVQFVGVPYLTKSSRLLYLLEEILRHINWTD